MITANYPLEEEGRELRTSADVINSFRGAYWLIRTFSQPDTGQLRPIRLLLLFAIPPALTALITRWEGTFSLASSGGRGFVEHLGWLTKYLAAPVIVLLLLHVVRTFAAILSDPRFIQCSTQWMSTPAAVQTVIVRWCCAETRRTHRLLVGLIMVGLFTVIANSQTTRVADAVYGEDVWDSNLHLGGYWAGKAFLVLEWGYLLPLTVFLALMIGKSVRYLVYRATEDPSNQLLVFAHDGCGGFRPLGQLMMQLVYIDIPVGVPMLFLALTHQKTFYSTLVLATILFVAAIVTQLFLPFLPLHEALEKLKSKKLQQLESFLAQLEQQLFEPVGSRPPADVTPLIAAECVYRRTMQLNTWPYGRADALKAVTPLLAPAATLLVRLIH